MSSGSKFWPSKQKKEKPREGVVDYDQLELMVEDYLRVLKVIKPSDEIEVSFTGTPSRGEPVSITYTIKTGGVGNT